MNLANATDLAQWANLRLAQDQLPQLMRRLIAATGKGVTTLSVRAGEGIGLPGWDGVVVAETPDIHVPAGLSVWEMGVSADPSTKANRDYNKRKADPGDVDATRTTFVFVTPRRWPGKDSWIADKQNEGFWQNVVAYDADDLETWLERALGIHAWFSALIGKDPHEVESLETWWDSWSRQTQPHFPAPLLLAGRHQAALQVRDVVRGVPTTLSLAGDSHEEVTAFFAAALLSDEAPPPTFALERALIVRSPSAWRRVAVSDQPLILLPHYPQPNVSLAIQYGHHVLVPLGREVPIRPEHGLPRLRRDGIEAALIVAGVPPARASTLATLGRRSLLSLRRTLAINPELQTPAWANPEKAREVLPAILAGVWRDDLEADQNALAKLADRPYAEFVRTLTTWANLSDPPVRQVGNIWMVIAKEDAWRLTARLLTSDDLQTLHQVVADVVGEVDPALDLSPRERMLASFLGKERRHSPYLFKGLADTLVLIAVTSDQVQLAGGQQGQNQVNTIVRALLDRANADHSGHFWISLASVLPLLAEATPDIFLGAVETDLRSANPVILRMFQDGAEFDAMFNSSEHPNLLWALETLAWSPTYLSRAALILAKLTRLDPGGSLLNRPRNSLRDILLLWRPGTAASLTQRLEVVDLLRQREPDVAWRLMLYLIPGHRDTASPPHSPVYRDWKPEQEDDILFADLPQAVEGLVRHALVDAGTNGSRWVALLNRVAACWPRIWSEVLGAFQNLPPNTFNPTERAALVNVLRGLAGRHQRHAAADWAIAPADVDRLVEVITLFEPDEPTTKHTWLFTRDAVHAFTEGDFDERLTALKHAQIQAISEVYDDVGLTGVLEWATMFTATSSAYTIGYILGEAKSGDVVESELFAALFSEVEAHCQVVRGYVSYVVYVQGDSWTDWVEAILKEWSSAWSPRQQAGFLSILPATARVWDLAEELGAETDQAYWQAIQPYNIPEQSPSASRAVSKLLCYERPYTAITFLDICVAYIPTSEYIELIKTALKQAIDTTPPDTFDSMFSYHVACHLDRLAEAGLDEAELAALEWAYLLLLRYEKRHSWVLNRSLATDPLFFVNVVSLAYMAEDEEPQDLTEERYTHTLIAADLLRAWRIVPGTQTDGSIDEATLREWVIEARKLLFACGRSEIGDHLIGQILRYGPGARELEWPVAPIRTVIEQVASDSLEIGFKQEVRNSRGVTVRTPTAGGQQERDLVAQYRGYAAFESLSWPRTAALLNRIAESYAKDARQHDLAAELTEDLWQ